MGMESFGNEPVAEQEDYRAWPGIMDLLNDKGRVYANWVNGNEYFHYRGGTDQLNDFLARFAAMESPVHEVIFKPGPGLSKSFGGKTVRTDWRLHLVGGIAAYMTKTEGTAAVWDVNPTLTVYMDDDEGIQPDKVILPEKVTVLQLSDLRKKFREAIRGGNPKLRAHGASFLAEEDPLNGENVPILAGLLDDEDAYVRAVAAGGLGRFGGLAKSALPDLQAAIMATDRQVSELARKSIEKIEDGPDQTDAVRNAQMMEKRIRRFSTPTAWRNGGLPAHTGLP